MGLPLLPLYLAGRRAALPFFSGGIMGRDSRQIGPVTLYHGDALDVLQDLRGVADLCVSDFPYRLTSGGRGQSGDGSMTGIFDPQDYDNSGDLMAMAEWHQMVPPVYRALKADADAYFMTNDKNLLLAGGPWSGRGLSSTICWAGTRARRRLTVGT